VHCGIALFPVESVSEIVLGATERNREIARSGAGRQGPIWRFLEAWRVAGDPPQPAGSPTMASITSAIDARWWQQIRSRRTCE
jgi:hypothetical protein